MTQTYNVYDLTVQHGLYIITWYMDCKLSNFKSSIRKILHLDQHNLAKFNPLMPNF